MAVMLERVARDDFCATAYTCGAQRLKEDSPQPRSRVGRATNVEVTEAEGHLLRRSPSTGRPGNPKSLACRPSAMISDLWR